MPHARGDADNGGLGDGVGIHVVGARAELYFYLGVEIEEVSDIGAGKDEIFLHGMMHMSAAELALAHYDIVHVGQA